MKIQTLTALFLAASLTGMAAQASTSQAYDRNEVQQKYESLVNQGKTYRDAFEELQYEIAYETAAVQAKSPCKKMVRGL